MNKSINALLCGLAVIALATSGCKSTGFSRLAWWKSEPTTLADTNSVPSPSETASPTMGGAAAQTAISYPNTGAQSSYATSPYNSSPYASGDGTGTRSSTYGTMPVGGATPYNANPYPVQTADANYNGGAAATYAVPSQYGATATPSASQGGASYPGGTAYNQGGTTYQSGAAYNQGGANSQGGAAYNQGGAAYNQGGAAYNQSGAAYPGGAAQPPGASRYESPVPATNYNNNYGQGAATNYGASGTNQPSSYPNTPAYNTQPYGQSGQSGAPRNPYQGASMQIPTTAPESNVALASGTGADVGDLAGSASYRPGSTARKSNVDINY